MNSSLRLELEYLNIQLLKSRSHLLKLASVLTPDFRTAVIEFSEGLIEFASRDDELRELLYLNRRDRKLADLGFRLGDVLILDRGDEFPLSFRLEDADYQNKRLGLPSRGEAGPGQVFRLHGRAFIPQADNLTAPITHVIETEQDASRVRVLLRAVAPGLAARDGKDVSGRCTINTFLTGLTRAQQKAWMEPGSTVSSIKLLTLADQVFRPRGTFWDATHKLLHGRLDFRAYRCAERAPFLSNVPKLYAEGRLIFRKLERLEARNVQRLMLFPTGSLVNVAPDNDPIWIRVERVDKRPQGVYIVGERINGANGEACYPVRVAVTRLAHAEQIRERVRQGVF